MRLNGITGALGGSCHTPLNLRPRNLVLYVAQAALNGLVPAIELLDPVDPTSFLASTVLLRHRQLNIPLHVYTVGRNKFESKLRSFACPFSASRYLIWTQTYCPLLYYNGQPRCSYAIRNDAIDDFQSWH